MDNLPAHRFECLDSFRGITACIIVFVHCRTQGVICNNSFVEHSYVLVDFFFVLSGFVIACSYGDKIAHGFSIGRFLFLRWSRIYPLHFAMLLVFVAFELSFLLIAPGLANRRPFSLSYSPGAIISNLFLVQIFFGPNGPSWNGPSWTIAAEFWTYLLFATIFRWLRSAVVPACLAIALASGSYLLFVSGRTIDVTHDAAFERCLYGFALGVVAYRLYSSRIDRFRNRIGVAVASTLEIVTLIALIAFVILAGGTRWSLASPIVFFLAMPVFALQSGAISRVLLLRPMLRLGQLSYSIYMVHSFLIDRLMNLLALLGRIIHHPLIMHAGTSYQVGGGPLFGDLVLIALLALTIAISWLTYNRIEEPARLWSRRMIFFSSPQAARPPAATSGLHASGAASGLP